MIHPRVTQGAAWKVFTFTPSVRKPSKANSRRSRAAALSPGLFVVASALFILGRACPGGERWPGTAGYWQVSWAACNLGLLEYLTLYVYVVTPAAPAGGMLFGVSGLLLLLLYVYVVTPAAVLQLDKSVG